MRKRFGYALLWFTHLHNQVQAHVDKVIQAPELTSAVFDIAVDVDGDDSESVSAPPSSPTPAARALDPVGGASPQASPSVGQRRKRRSDSDDVLDDEPEEDEELDEDEPEESFAEPPDEPDDPDDPDDSEGVLRESVR